MSFHKITVVGNVGSEVSERVTATGKEVANFSLAVNERYGEAERTTWYKVTAWEGLSRIVAEHVQKGRLLLVEGTPAVEAWRDADGKPRAQMVITARELRFLGAKPDTAEEEEIPV